MKFRILLSVFIVTVISSISVVALAKDIKKGTIQISGNSTTLFGTSTEEVDGEKQSKVSGLNLQVEALYYVVDNFAVGALAGYSNNDYTSYYKDSGYYGDSSGSDTQNSVTKRIGPILQISVPMNNTTNLFIAATAGYASEEVEDYYKADGIFYGASAGVSIFPVDNFSLDLGISYLHDSGKDDLSKLDVDRDDLHGKIGLSVYF